MAASHDPDSYLPPTERRVVRVRRHWSVVARAAFETLALLAAAILVTGVLPSGMSLPQNVLWYGGLAVVLRFAYRLYAWWTEVLVVTDKRFVLTSGVLSTRVVMLPLAKVTDLTYERTSIGRVFGYGTLVVESAGQFPAFRRIEHLPEPERVHDAVSELVFGDRRVPTVRAHLPVPASALTPRRVTP
jgi:membrane protein YdbS with pleckstrin-like domain